METIRPANQVQRIKRLRLAMFVFIPLMAFSRPIALLPELAMELIESLGILMIIGGVLGRFWSILYVGGRKNAEIVRIGPYSICRHPLYLFSTLAVAGFGLMLGSLVVTAVMTGAVFLILSDVAGREERFLRSEFGPAYDAYAAEVPRILPAWAQFHTPANVTFDVSTLRRNLADALVFLSLIPMGELLEYLKEIPSWPTVPIP